MSYQTLFHIPNGATASVRTLHAKGSIRRRLLDMGLTEGAKATCLYESPAGDPKAYLIRGAVVALRSAEAKQVEIRREG